MHLDVAGDAEEELGADLASAAALGGVGDVKHRAAAEDIGPVRVVQLPRGVGLSGPMIAIIIR